MLKLDMETKIKTDLLKFQAGHEIWCRPCGQVLDYRRAVSVDYYRGTELQASRILCGTCFDKRKPTIDANAECNGYRLEITDGRVLVPASRKRRAS